jgi:hypothetical protein
MKKLSENLIVFTLTVPYNKAGIDMNRYSVYFYYFYLG